jgi:hypothetical protein
LFGRIFAKRKTRVRSHGIHFQEAATNIPTMLEQLHLNLSPTIPPAASVTVAKLIPSGKPVSTGVSSAFNAAAAAAAATNTTQHQSSGCKFRQNDESCQSV